MLSRRERPGPGKILASATLIGAIPMPLIFQGDEQAILIFGLAGLIGGIAFLAVSWRAGEVEEQ